MLKKLIFTFFILIFSIFSLTFVNSDSIPVENIFSDIDSDYKYNSIYLYDLTGREIEKQNYSGSNKTSFNIEFSGLYFVKIIINNQAVSKKVFVSK